jgi:hypothetical protein
MPENNMKIPSHTKQEQNSKHSSCSNPIFPFFISCAGSNFVRPGPRICCPAQGRGSGRTAGCRVVAGGAVRWGARAWPAAVAASTAASRTATPRRAACAAGRGARARPRAAPGTTRAAGCAAPPTSRANSAASPPPASLRREASAG